MKTNWTKYFQAKQDEMVAELKRYVEIETPTHNKVAVDCLGAFITERFEALGCRVTTHPQSKYGDQLRVEYGDGDEQILVLGHFDTVKEIGTLDREPLRMEDGKLYGPGTYDMKAGIVFSYFALKAIIDESLALGKKLVFFWNTDEEVGSPSSRALIQEEGRRSALALVIEPAYGDGLLKTSRKGSGEFVLKVKGRSAHAGSDHARGINAIDELAYQIMQIRSWTDYQVGTTLSVGKIDGGTAYNVVPEYAEAVIDVRISKASEAERVTALMHGLTTMLEGTKLTVEGTITTMPMERTAQTEKLFHHAQAQAQLEGFALGEMSVGGTSDGNVVSVVGIPVLDGLGPVGDGAHASHEHVVVGRMAERVALLVRMFTTL